MVPMRKLLGGVIAEFPWWGQNSFILPARDSFRCNNVVNIIENWDILAEYAGEKLGFYQILENDGITEIRVLTGRLGFKREFQSREDPVYVKIMDFCRKNRFIKISQTTRDEQFFK